MIEEKSPPSGVVYECLQCGAKVTADQLALMPEIKCHECGYRVLKKTRSPIVKKIKAV